MSVAGFRAAWATAATVAALGLAGGCGGSDDAGGPQGSVGTDAQSSPSAGEQTTGPSGGSGKEGGTESRGGEARSGQRRGGESPDRGAEGPERGGMDAQGEEGAPGGKGAPSSAKAAFVRQAGEICRRGRAERERALARYARRNASKPAAARVEGSLQGIYVPRLEAQIAALRRLTPPPGDGAEVAAILEAMEDWVALVKQGGRRAKAQVDQAIGRATKLTRRYGLAGCVAG